MKASLILIAASMLLTACEIMPRNTLGDCRLQCEESKRSKACLEFCDCIHKNGSPLDSCLDQYNKAANDDIRKNNGTK